MLSGSFNLGIWTGAITEVSLLNVSIPHMEDLHWRDVLARKSYDLQVEGVLPRTTVEFLLKTKPQLLRFEATPLDLFLAQVEHEVLILLDQIRLGLLIHLCVVDGCECLVPPASVKKLLHSPFSL